MLGYMIGLRPVGLALAVVTLAACGNDTRGERIAEEPGLDETVIAMDPASVDPKRIDFPLDPYGENVDLDAISQAIDILEQECFRRFGLDLPLPDPGARNQWPFPTWDWYGLWDEETARAHGYRSPPLVSRESFADSVPPDWADVLAGSVETFNGVEVPDGGCQGEAFRTLGVEEGDDGLVSIEGLQREANSRARQHDAVEALIDEWSDCLAQAGWEFTDPSDPFGYWQDAGSTGGSDPPAEELDMALADISCKKESGLLRAWVAAEVAHQRILVEENAEGLRELTEWRDGVLRRANDIVAGN
jgi:hypothetical protein